MDIQNKDLPRVALIFGGRGYERKISEASAGYVLSVIDKTEILPIPIRISECGAWLISNDSFSRLAEHSFTREAFPVYLGGKSGFVSEGEFIPIDCALPVLHGDFGEDGVVQGALENARIRYVGCDVICGAVCSDKSFTKAVAEHMGIPVVRWITSSPEESARDFARRAEERIGYPIFVKPARLGSSVGAMRANDRAQLLRAAEDAMALSDRIVAEECADILCELECAYFCADGRKIFSDVGAIEYNGGFYDYDSKYSDSSRAAVSDSPTLEREISKRVRKYSELLCSQLGIRHLARIDFFLTRDGELIFNEINTFPGFTGASLYPRLISRCGISPSEMITLLVRDTLGA